MIDKLSITLFRSPIGTPVKQRSTVRGLGLKKMWQTRELMDTPEVRGMLFKVRHLVRVNEDIPVLVKGAVPKKIK